MPALGRARPSSRKPRWRGEISASTASALTQTAVRAPLAEQSAEVTLRRFVSVHGGHARSTTSAGEDYYLPGSCPAILASLRSWRIEQLESYTGRAL